ncbi:hypothetical protein KHM83_07315 [Fusibacter paucivorans]|uniref:5-bromo-4-chloroindolyl phosphate hydrolysis protein n=1 Tax=Fusibacter paucivorans TaxID=76009 RepID=A0ABS5PMV4_9FIRM|nr:hypothetical protein [Fusibacter paucivorans]MBS7526483.1 hypothetical protein [Fusibacter paucivorans]
MTKKITKGLISLGFLAVGLSMALHGQIGRGGATITLAVAGMYWVEYREGMRYFDAILQRIFVCVSLDTVDELTENLSKQMIYRQIAKEVSAMTTLLTAYYSGQFEMVRNDQQVYYVKRLRRWHEAMVLHAKLALGEILDETMQTKIKRLKSEATDAIEIRNIELLTLKSETITIESVASLRQMDNSNLHTAELSSLMATLADNPNRQRTYQKSANNLAPETFIYHPIEEV